MYQLSKEVTFDAAHYIPGHKGKCAALHGHRWEVEVDLRVENLPEDGMVADFGIIKKIIHEFDHTNLNNILPFSNNAFPPTAENIARHLSDLMLECWPARFDFVSVSVTESEGSTVTYIPPSMDL